MFTRFENEEYINKEDLKYVNDYVCGNLNSDYCPNYKYWYNQYGYATKAFIVCRWREKRGLQPVAKWGEAICENELVNFFKDEKHKNCSCGSVYYKFQLLIFKRKKILFFAL